MRRHIVCLSIAAIAIAPISLTTSPSIAQSNEQECSLIGRIQQGQSENYSTDDIICNGAQILNPTNVEFLCFQNRRLIPITRTTNVDTTFCAQSTTTGNTSEATQCDTTRIVSRWLCVISKGPEDNTQFTVLQPNLVSGPRPDIAWEAIEDANTYTVYLAGPDIQWQRTMSAEVTELPYPEAEASLTIGTAYEVLVTAHSNTEQIATSIPKTINVTNIGQGGVIQLAARINGAQ